MRLALSREEEACHASEICLPRAKTAHQARCSLCSVLRQHRLTLGSDASALQLFALHTELNGAGKQGWVPDIEALGVRGIPDMKSGDAGRMSRGISE